MVESEAQRAVRGRDARRRGVRPRADAGRDRGDPRARRRGRQAGWDWQPPAKDEALIATVARARRERRCARPTRSAEAGALASASTEIYAKRRRRVRRRPTRRRARRERRSTNMLFDLEAKIVRSQILDGEPRIDGRDTRTVRPISDPHRRAAAHPRLGAVHARRDAGAGRRHARHRARRADHRRADGRVPRALHAPLQHAAVTPPARPAASGSPKRREIGHGRLAKRALVAVLPTQEEFAYSMRVVSEITESNGSLVDGLGVRRQPRADGRRRADQGARRRHRDGPDQGRQPLRGADRHPGRRGSPRRHGLQGRRHRQAASPRCRWTSRSRASPRRSCRSRWRRRSEGRLHILGKMQRGDARARATEVSQLRAAHDHDEDQPGEDPRRHRQGRRGHPRAHRRDRHHDRHRGRRHDHDRLASTPKAARRAKKRIEEITAEVEVGKIYEGPVLRLLDFGAIVQLLPGQGRPAAHLADRQRARQAGLRLPEGRPDRRVKVLEADDKGRVRLSMKAVKEQEQGAKQNA